MKSFKDFISESRSQTFEIPDDSNFIELPNSATKRLEHKYKVKISNQIEDMGLMVYYVIGRPSDVKKMLSDLGDDEEIFDMMGL